MDSDVGNVKGRTYALLTAGALVLAVGLGIASVAVRSVQHGAVAPVSSGVASAAASDAAEDSADALDPTKGPIAWGHQVARIMSRAFPENDGGLITAGELLSLGPVPEVGKRIPWDRMKDSSIVEVEIGGTDLLAAFASAVKYYPRKNGSFLQVYGLRALCRQGERTTQLTGLAAGDETVVPGGTYHLAVTEFMAKGAGPFVGLKSVKTISEPVSLLGELKKRLFPTGVVSEPEPTYVFSQEAG